jgi:hypothetical protein
MKNEMKNQIDNAKIVIEAINMGIWAVCVIIVCLAIKYIVILITDDPIMFDCLYFSGLIIAAIIYKLIAGYYSEKEKNGNNKVS